MHLHVVDAERVGSGVTLFVAGVLVAVGVALKRRTKDGVIEEAVGFGLPFEHFVTEGVEFRPANLMYTCFYHLALRTVLHACPAQHAKHLLFNVVGHADGRQPSPGRGQHHNCLKQTNVQNKSHAQAVACPIHWTFNGHRQMCQRSRRRRTHTHTPPPPPPPSSRAHEHR